MNELEIEYRGAQVAAVSFPKRTIELIVMPYEAPAAVNYRGRTITEICSRGAYDGVEERASRIRVNLDHDQTRPVGKTVALHPSRHEGLVAEVRISRTTAGSDALELADDGIYGASAGFGLLIDKTTGRVKPDAEVWETRDRRRLNHLYLDHIALTPNPAYEGAEIVDVRAQAPPEPPSPTPNRDRLELEHLRQLYADIDRRYGLGR